MMHKVDPIEIMLSDIFDKVFYSKEENCECGLKEDGTWSEEVFDRFGCTCEDCDGVGWVEAEFVRPQNFDRDVGYLDTKRVDCEECGGTGFMEVEDE